MRIAWWFLAAAALVALVCSTVIAQEAVPTMEVAVGFDGYCRGDDWCPIYVILSNEGPQIEGELRITPPGQDNGDVYTTPVLLPPHSRKAYTLIVPLTGNRSARMKVLLTADGHHQLASQQVSFRYVNAQDRLYGVIGRDSSALNFLSDVAPSGQGAAVAHLDIATLPPSPLGWRGLDVLVLNDVDTTSFSTDQLQALATWLSLGGHLIVGGGANGAQTAAGVTDLLPVTIGPVRTVDSLASLGHYIGADSLPGHYAITEATLREGQPLVSQDSLLLIARREIGAGTVDYVAYDAGLNPFANWEDNVRLWRSLVETGVTPRQRLSAIDGYNARAAATAIPGIRPPSTWHLIAFLLTYAVLVGPVNYLVLRKLDRRELAWLTVPLLALGFTILAYVTGFQIRGRLPTLHRLALVYGPEETNIGEVTEVVGLFSPRRAQYDVQVDSGAIRPIPPTPYNDTNSLTLRVIEEGETWTADNLRANVGQVQTFIVEGFTPLTPPQAHLQLEVGERGVIQIRGSLRNGPIPLQSAVLVVGQHEISLGTLEAGQTITNISAGGLKMTPSGELETTTPFRATIGLESPPGSPDDPEYQRQLWLNAILADNWSSLEPDIYLVGWGDQAPLDVGLAGRPARTSDLVLYVFELPVVPPESGENLTITPALIARRPEEPSGYVEMTDSSFQLSAGASLVLRFSIWQEVTVSQVDRMTLTLVSTGYAATETLPKLEMWNWESEQWEEQGVAWGQNDIPGPSRYVRPDGVIRARLTASETWVEIKDVTISIEGQQ